MERDRGRELRIEQGPTRCPFCHESVAVETEAWVACERCLARHHPDCWKESKNCASCGETRSLARDAREPSDDVTRAFTSAGLPVRFAPYEPSWAGRGRIWHVERLRELPFEVPATMRGVFRGNRLSTSSGAHSETIVSLDVEGGRTFVRVRTSLFQAVAATFAMLLVLPPIPLAGILSEKLPSVNVAGAVLDCVLVCTAVAILVARWIVRAYGRNLERVLLRLERDLARPSPPSPKDAD